MWEIKFTFHKYYLFGRFLSTKAKETHTDQKYFKLLYSVTIKATHKPSKVAAAKMFLPVPML